MNLMELNNFIGGMSSDEVAQISDGYHTFEELYEFRKIYNALAFNLLYEQDRLTRVFRRNNFVHKSWKHSDGEWCFGKEKEWFIVAAQLPDGKGDYQTISNHYKAEDWDLFKIPEMSQSVFEFDGHTSQDVLTRILDFIKIQ